MCRVIGGGGTRAQVRQKRTTGKVVMRKAIKEVDPNGPEQYGAPARPPPRPKLRLRAGQLVGWRKGTLTMPQLLLVWAMMTLKGRCNCVGGDLLRVRQFSNKARGGGPGSLGEALRFGGAQNPEDQQLGRDGAATATVLYSSR